MGRVCGRKHFIRTLTGRFPEIAGQIDKYVRGLLHCEMGVFARATQEALDRGHLDVVKAHFQYADELLAVAGPELENALAVSYLEHLPWDKNYLPGVNPRNLLSPNLAELLLGLEEHLNRIFQKSTQKKKIKNLTNRRGKHDQSDARRHSRQHH